MRRYLPLDRFDEAAAFHKGMIGQKARLWFHAISNWRKSPAFCSSLEWSIATHATFMVDDIQGFAANIATSTRRTGCRIRSNPTKLPSPIAVSQQPIQPCHAIAGMA